MRGHRQIIRARLDGLMPKAVFVDVGYPELPIMSKYDDPENNIIFGVLPTVEIAKSEVGNVHDFRFLVGCSVHVQGSAMDESFCYLLDQIAEKAARVIACAGDEIMEFTNGNWTVWNS